MWFQGLEPEVTQGVTMEKEWSRAAASLKLEAESGRNLGQDTPLEGLVVVGVWTMHMLSGSWHLFSRSLKRYTPKKQDSFTKIKEKAQIWGAQPREAESHLSE